MSENKFNPLAESQARADVGRQIYEQFMERDNSSASIEEHVQGHEQFVEYLESRPYTDDKGKLHDPLTGKFINEEDAGLLYTPHSVENGEEKDEYSSMSLSQLAMLSAEAEVHGDKTTLSSVDDAILDKIEAIGLEDEYVETDGTLRDKSELDNYYDRVMKLRDGYVAKLSPEKEPIERKALPMPAVVKVEVNEDADENDAEVIDAEIIEDEDQDTDLPPITVNDESDVIPPIIFDNEPEVRTKNPQDKWGTPGRGDLAETPTDFATRPRTAEAQEKKKKSWGKRILGGIALIGLVGGSIFAANRIMDDENSGSDKAPVTSEAPDSGVDFGAATESLETTTTPEEVPVDTEAPDETEISSTNSDEAQAEAVTAVVANYTPEQQAEMSGDAASVVVSGDVMPSTNVEQANVANHRVTMQAALDTYNLIHSTNFQFGEGDMFWNGDKVINPAELAEYNAILKQIIEEASK